MSLQDDPVNEAIQGAIYGGIKRGIEVTMENECWGSALILIYSGIDAMASLGMPNNQEKVTRRDFKNWVSRYLKDSSDQSYPAEDMYGARCAILHQYGSESELSRDNQCRVIDHVDRGSDVYVLRGGGEERVWLNWYALAKNFYSAIDRFIVDMTADSSKRPVFEKRLDELLQVFPLPK